MKKFNATYSLEDNKIRIYPTTEERLSPELYNKVKDAGFIWAPKQKLFVAPMWTPSREAVALELCETIENEDTTLEQRAIDRAARFDNYSVKRAQDAENYADAADKLSEPFKNGQPILIGHHSQRKAEKLRDKIQNTMKKAVSFYDQSNYWASRSEGVLANAASKSNVRTRINRIKGLESDKRKQEKNIEECKNKINIINSRLDSVMKRKDGTVLTDLERHELIFGIMRGGCKITDAEYEQYKLTKYTWAPDYCQLLRAGYPVETLKSKALQACENTIEQCEVWLNHFNIRIAYERDMLKASGHDMPDFKAIGAARRAKTCSNPIVNTPDLLVTERRGSTLSKPLKVFEITKEQFKKLGSREHVHVNRAVNYRYRSTLALWLEQFGLVVESGFNGRHESIALFIKDQKRVDVPAQLQQQEAV